MFELSTRPPRRLRPRPFSRSTPRAAPRASSWTRALACCTRGLSARATPRRTPPCAWSQRGAASPTTT
eukprot:1283920-Lingulodinium_polyedra.AAC.1